MEFRFYRPENFIIFAVMKKILIVDNYDSFVFNIVQLLRESPLTPVFDIVRNDRINFSRLPEYGGIILSPGPGIPSEAGELSRLIDYCKHTHPLLGICLGHQAIAESFGASLFQLAHPLHGHRSILKITDYRDPVFTGLSGSLAVGRYHSWVVTPRTVPKDLLISSVDEEGNIMSFYHRTLPIHGLQFHPESYLSDCGKVLLENWLSSQLTENRFLTLG